MIDNYLRTDFLNRLRIDAQARFYQWLVTSGLFAATTTVALILGWPVASMVGAGCLVIGAFVLRSYRALKRACASLEAVYRREDSRCRPWG